MSNPALNPTPTPSLVRRMACWLYEGILVFGVTFIPAYFFSVITNTRHALHQRPALQALLLFVLILYFVWFWCQGHTLAMKTWRIRLCAATGAPLRYGRASWRLLCCQIWFLPLWLQALVQALGFSGSPAAHLVGWQMAWPLLWACAARLQPQRQFWHDMWAGTRLVQAS